MLISIKNIKFNESNFLRDGSHVSVLHNRFIVADITFNLNSEAISEESIDLIELYFSVKDAFIQSFLRGLESYIRADFEIILNVVPIADNCVIEIQLPHQYDNLNIESKRLDIYEAREIILSLEKKIRSELIRYRKNILELFEDKQAERAFDLIRLIDNGIDVKS